MAVIKCVGNRGIEPVLVEGKLILKIYWKGKLLASPEFTTDNAFLFLQAVQKEMDKLK